VSGISIRLLAPGDEEVVRELATYEGPGDPEALLADPRTLMLVACDGERPVGFVLAHDLPRRHGDRSQQVGPCGLHLTQARAGIAQQQQVHLADALVQDTPGVADVRRRRVGVMSKRGSRARKIKLVNAST